MDTKHLTRRAFALIATLLVLVVVGTTSAGQAPASALPTQQHSGQVVVGGPGGGAFTDIGVNIPGVAFGNAVWGDYNGDGKLDVLITGQGKDEHPFTAIYAGDGQGRFTKDSIAALAQLDYSDAAWGDYNSDGKLDLVVAGCTGCGSPVTKVYAGDGEGHFTEDTAAGIIGLIDSRVAWGDYNGDGKLDLLISGRVGENPPVTKLYKGDGHGTFTEDTSAQLPGVDYGSIAWGDYNNDGKLDILLTGGTSKAAALSAVYTGDGQGGFTLDTSAHLPALSYSAAAWGDYNGDGKPDILMSGQDNTGTLISVVYTGDGQGGFSKDQAAHLIGVDTSSVAWADYNHDGKLDLLITGFDQSYNPTTLLYAGDGEGGFTLDQAARLAGVHHGSVAWGDYNGDGYPDILLTGYGQRDASSPLIKLYRNDMTSTTPPPPSPLPTAARRSR